MPSPGLLTVTLSGKLLAELSPRGAHDNVCLSPLSIAMALALVVRGAEGETLAELRHALGLEALTQSDIDALASSLMKGLPSGLGVANSLWLREGDELSPEFRETCESHHLAAVGSLADGAAAINRWASEATHGRIRQIVGSITPLDILILVNTVYFKRDWEDQFQPHLTQDDDFERADGTRVRCPFMRQENWYRYVEEAGTQAITLPYTNTYLAMDVVLPAKSQGVDELVRRINHEGYFWLAPSDASLDPETLEAARAEEALRRYVALELPSLPT